MFYILYRVHYNVLSYAKTRTNKYYNLFVHGKTSKWFSLSLSHISWLRRTSFSNRAVHVILYASVGAVAAYSATRTSGTKLPRDTDTGDFRTNLAVNIVNLCNFRPRTHLCYTGVRLGSEQTGVDTTYFVNS